MKKRIFAIGVIFFGVVAILVSIAGPLFYQDAFEEPYNFVIILTDDQRWDTVGDTGVNAEIREQFGRPVMPHAEDYLVEKGVLFTNAFVTTPLCCPYRASMLAGGFYAHNTGVLDNHPPNGGVQRFQDTETMAVLLQDAGYKTGFIGKYMNGYPDIAPYVPPGWTKFVATFKKLSWFDFYVAVGSSRDRDSQGEIKDISDFYSECSDGSDPTNKSECYLTNFQKEQALDFIEQYGDSPFFLYFNTYAPHLPATPAPGDEGLFPGYKYRNRAYGEKNLMDKPKSTKRLGRGFKKKKKKRDEAYRNQLRSLQGVDRAVKAIVDKIDEMGKLDRTVFIFTSDNGYMWGEHRLSMKGVPYEESIRVPFVIVMPGIEPGVDDRLVTANLDIGTTIFDLAGIVKETDGQSLVPLLEDSNAFWREDFLIEVFCCGGHTWAGLRVKKGTEEWKYVEYVTGDKELYDLVNDPYEEESQHNNPAYQDVMERLEARLEPLKGLTITVFGTPKGDLGQDYNLQLTAWGGKKPYTWRIIKGQLPKGLSLNRSSGLISGIPLKPEKQKVLIRVEDSSAKQTRRHRSSMKRPQSFIQEFKFMLKHEVNEVLTHGPLVGTVTDNSAQIWFRVEPETDVQVRYAPDPDFDDDPMMSQVVTTSAEHDYTGTITLEDLAENTTYYYQILVDGENQTPTQPQFKTFPNIPVKK